MTRGMNDVRGQKKREREFYRGRHIDLLRWGGLQLRLKSGRLLATVEPDSKWPKMYRVRLPNGHLTDMVNLLRAKDAATSLAMQLLNGDIAAKAVEAPPMRFSASGLSTHYQA